MKALAALMSSVVLALMGMPFLFGAGVPGEDCLASDTAIHVDGEASAEMETILATIRQRESGGDYQAKAPGSTASGAYQFIDTTWAHYGSYAEAWQAPPEIQDAKATEQVRGILDAHSGNVEAVPVVWYIGWYPADGDPAWDSVPYPGAGNALTPQQYRDEWMATYRENLATPGPDAEVAAGDSCDRGPVAPDGWAYPADSELFATAPVDAPHHDYPAWDWGIPASTAIYAIRGGDVVGTYDWPYNCFGAHTLACQPCGIGVTIQDGDGTRWTYCHGGKLHVQQGDTVAAGQQIVSSGTSGRSTGPHLHLAIRTADGQARCPQPLLQALRDDGAAVAPQELPNHGCTY